MRKFYLIFLLYVVTACITVYKTSNPKVEVAEQNVRNNTLLLLGEKGYCTASSIYGPSGKLYTITAAHCNHLEYKGMYGLINDKKEVTTEYLVAIDPKSDLLLLTSKRKDGINVANNESRYVYTITHGNGYSLFKTTGELMELANIIYVIFPILAPPDHEKCTKSGLEKLGSDCVQVCSLYISTAKVFLGSSGGPVLNMDGELTGIVSGYNLEDQYFSYISPLSSIKAILKGK